MNNSQPLTEEQLRTRVMMFCRHVQKAYESRKIFRRLFEKKPESHKDINDDYQSIEEGKAIEESVPYLFDWLFFSLRSFTLLEAAKLMDPKESKVGGQVRENITFEWIESHIQDPEVVANLEALRISDFRPYIKEERDRSISHSDVEYLGDPNPKGEFPEEADKAFYEKLQLYVNILHDHVFGGPYVMNDSMILNDIETMLYRLKKTALL